jgi:methylated-DNA-[protein]-cysteine S-methyltransferase
MVSAGTMNSRISDRASVGTKEEPMDVAYRILDSPIGRLLVAATPKGLVRVAFDIEGFDAVLAEIARRIGPRVIELPARLDPVAAELDEYFSGTRRSFDLALDDTLLTGFRGEVQSYLPTIGYATTASYKQIAERLGNPRAIRAVGSACATNPIPIVLPCHRVLRSDGGLGGYRGGLAAKRALLALEADRGAESR